MSLALFFGVLVLLLVLTVPICVSFAFVTLLPSIVDASFPYTADAAVRSMVSGLNNFPLLAIPLFIIAGVIMAKGQISERLFNVFSYFVGNRTAGLPCAVTITCLFYGAISGSGPATTAAVGSMCIPLLTSVGYDLTFATALVAVSGSLGIIIPPSIPYIMYCNASGASISELFLAGFLPGVLIALCLMVYSYIYCKIHGEDKDKLNAKCMELRAKGLGTVLKEGFWALMSPRHHSGRHLRRHLLPHRGGYHLHLLLSDRQLVYLSHHQDPGSSENHAGRHSFLCPYPHHSIRGRGLCPCNHADECSHHRQ